MNSNSLKKFQKQLQNDSEAKTNFISGGDDDDKYDSESESDNEELKITLPKKKSKHSSSVNELLQQLSAQHQHIFKIQKKMYSLKNEIDRQEHACRYLKLDLNNAQVITEETKTELEQSNVILRNYKFEAYIERSLLILYFLWKIYSYIYSFF